MGMSIIASYSLQEFVDRSGNQKDGRLDHYLHINTFPGDDSHGEGVYMMSKKVACTFRFAPAGSAFNAWYADAPERKFCLVPTRTWGDSGDIVGMAMTFPELPKFVARFGLQWRCPDAQAEKKTKVAIRKKSAVLSRLRKYCRTRVSNAIELEDRTFKVSESVLFKLRQKYGAHVSHGLSPCNSPTISRQVTCTRVQSGDEEPESSL